MEYILKAIFRQLNLDYKTYMLVNNYGFIVESRDYSIDIQHVLNVYGVEYDVWNMTVLTQNTRKVVYNNNIDDLSQQELMELIQEYC